MHLLVIDLEYRVIIGISAMVILFTSFLLSFVINQRKKIQYHKSLHQLSDELQKDLTKQNEALEKGVQQRTSELLNEKEKLQNTLTHLRSAQAQLVQAEKMASLGELVAGIAHEIQNPLNFINNFSDLNSELIEEMKIKIQQGNNEEVFQLINDITENEQRINHHGKRADGIVKGMLQHSRSSSGLKEAVNINKLADEYLQLAYHGLRAKDKIFNAALKTNYDSSINTINIIAQDIGRVLLNCLTNAFYAVTEKKLTGIANYEPTVSISTKKIGTRVEILIADNGNGISPGLCRKIFQPFFTTKPSGQGTGLGLSISYDIVTKGHSGELRVESKEGEGATFIIILPI